MAFKALVVLNLNTDLFWPLLHYSPTWGILGYPCPVTRLDSNVTDTWSAGDAKSPFKNWPCRPNKLGPISCLGLKEVQLSPLRMQSGSVTNENSWVDHTGLEFLTFCNRGWCLNHEAIHTSIRGHVREGLTSQKAIFWPPRRLKYNVGGVKKFAVFF